MATIPTKNPVPSESYEDLRYNSGVLDAFLNSQEDKFTDRLGVQKETLKSITVNAASAEQIENAKTAAEQAAADASASSSSASDSAASATSSANAAATSANNAANSASAASTSAGNAASNASAAASSATSAAASASAAASPSGVIDGSNAAAGKVGQVITNQQTGVSLTSGTPANLTSITLTPGDWDIFGTALLSNTGVNITLSFAGFNTTSASLPSFPNVMRIETQGGTTSMQNGVPSVRYNVTVNTVIYLVGQATFSTGTSTGSGFIRARRMH
jgi:hypothetical protein